MALTQEDLQAIGALMDDRLEKALAPVNMRLETMQKDITHIKDQVDIAYKWVDRIDLRVKALEHG